MPYVDPREANNRLIDSLEEIKARNGSPPWRERMVATERFRMVLLCWPPGHHHLKHYHPRVDESIFICEGHVRAIFDDDQEIVAGPGSFLFAERGVAHDMIVIGERPLIMIAVVAPNEPNDDIFL